jgi:hypothetical protein
VSVLVPEEPGLTKLIANEIRALRKGRGIQAIGLEHRLGPHLRELVAGSGERGVAVLRHSLIGQINGRAAELPEDLRVTITASLGLSDATRQMPYFADRVSWLAAHLGRDERTAQRRIDEAEQLLAEELTRELLRRRGRAPASPAGWYLDDLRTLLRLDTPVPESHEHRRIVATRAGLTEVMAWLDVPRDHGQPRLELQGEMLYGGRLIRREQPTRNRFQFIVQLPSPMQPGDEHEYGLLLRMPPDQPMRPHYIFTPECQCNRFDLRVRFDTERPPRWLRRVEGETVRTFDEAQPKGDLLQLDEAGELHVEFGNPALYLGYGVQWQP